MGQIENQMPRTRDESSGQYAETYSREAFTDAIRAEGGMAGTQEIADRVGCVYDTAYKKLRALEDEGYVTSRKVANARLWMVDSE